MTSDFDDHQLELLLDSALGDVNATAAPRIRVSGRARRLSVRVYPDARVEVVVPRRARPREIELFLAAHREWIDEKRAHALRTRPAPEPFPPASIQFPLTGERWRLHLAGGEGAVRIAAARDADAAVLRVAGDAHGLELRRALRTWLSQAARERLDPLLAAAAARIGVRYDRLAIRRQRSRWGSCSVRGTISLNACLVFQRSAVVDYLLVHELTHVKHMNHSARFWQAVERHCVDWRALDRELLNGWRSVPRWVFSEE